jgi:hypothetical protein
MWWWDAIERLLDWIKGSACVLLVGCAMHVPPERCEDWTWIDDEWCSMDECHQMQDATYGECRDGVCWCCVGNECWEGR